MSKYMSRPIILSLALSAICLGASPIYAGGGGGMSGGATEMTQLENNSELVKQLQEQVEQTKKLFEQYQNMLQNTMQLPMEMWSQITGEFTKVQNMFNSMNDLISGSFQSFENFKLEFLSFGKTSPQKEKDFIEQQEKFSNKSEQIANDAADGLKTEVDSIKTAKELNQKIQDAGRSSEGQMQALQTGITALGAINDTLLDLRTTIAEQRMAELEYRNLEQAKEDAEMESIKKAIGTWKPQSQGQDWSKEGF